jgi:hypothetical protein
MNYVNALHIFLVGPLLVLIGALKPSNPLVYYALFVMGIGIMVRFIFKLTKKGLVSSHSLWYVVHIILFATTLMYVGWNGKHTPKTMFSLLMALGITAIAYHGVRVIGV